MSWRYSVYPGIDTLSKTRQARHPCWMRAHVITLTSNLKTWCAGGVGGVNRITRSGCVPEQVWTGHRPETGTVPVNFSRCERYTNEWNGTGTGPEREPEQVWTGPKKLSVISHEPSTVTTCPIYGASCYSIRGNIIQRHVLPLLVLHTHILCRLLFYLVVYFQYCFGHTLGQFIINSNQTKNVYTYLIYLNSFSQQHNI